MKAKRYLMFVEIDDFYQSIADCAFNGSYNTLDEIREVIKQDDLKVWHEVFSQIVVFDTKISKWIIIRGDGGFCKKSREEMDENSFTQYLTKDL